MTMCRRCASRVKRAALPRDKAIDWAGDLANRAVYLEKAGAHRISALKAIVDECGDFVRSRDLNTVLLGDQKTYGVALELRREIDELIKAAKEAYQSHLHVDALADAVINRVFQLKKVKEQDHA